MFAPPIHPIGGKGETFICHHRHPCYDHPHLSANNFFYICIFVYLNIIPFPLPTWQSTLSTSYDSTIRVHKKSIHKHKQKVKYQARIRTEICCQIKIELRSLGTPNSIVINIIIVGHDHQAMSTDCIDLKLSNERRGCLNILYMTKSKKLFGYFQTIFIGPRCP